MSAVDPTAATLIGVPAGQLNELPGRRIVVTRDGMWQVDIPVSCAFADMVTLMPAPYSECPDFPFCGLDEVSNICEEGDMVNMVLTYKGLPSATSTPVYELLLSSQQEPLESNPLFANLPHADITAINAYLNSADPNAADPTSTLSDAGSKLLAYKLKGVTDYLAITFVWKRSEISNAPLAGLDVTGCGYISEPPGGAPTPEGCTWLYSGATQVREGGVYRLSNEWRLSAPGGWDEYLYTLGSTPASGSEPSSS